MHNRGAIIYMNNQHHSFDHDPVFAKGMKNDDDEEREKFWV